MSTQAIAGVGTQLLLGSLNSPQTFTALAEVRQINGPTAETQQLEATNLDSTGGYREYIPGFIDPGQLTFEANWTLASYGLAVQLQQDQSVRDWKIAYPNAEDTEETFQGFVMSVGKAIDFNDIVKATVTIKVTGAITVTS